MQGRRVDGGDDSVMKPPQGLWYRRKYPLGLENGLNPFFTNIVQQILPIRARLGPPGVGPKPTDLDHPRSLRDRAQQNAARLGPRHRANGGCKPQAFSQRFGEDDAARLVHSELHAIDYAIYHNLWQGKWDLTGSNLRRHRTLSPLAVLAAAFCCFCASASSLRKIRIPLSTCFSCSRNGGKKRNTVSWVTLISRPLASAPSRIGLPGTVNCSA